MKICVLTVVWMMMAGISSVYGQYDSLAPQGIYKSDFIIDELPRSITYYMPQRYGSLESYPLVIFLHDDNSTVAATIKAYGEALHAIADSADCVVMYPETFEGYWNSSINTTPATTKVTDISFITIMLDFFIQQYNCDTSRIYLFGVGNGGNMCYRFFCERPYKPSAIATLNAGAGMNQFANCRAAEEIPVSTVNKPALSKRDVVDAFHYLLKQQKPAAIKK